MYNTFFISFFISNRKHWCGHLVSRCGDLVIAGEAQLGVGFTMERGTDLPKDYAQESWNVIWLRSPFKLLVTRVFYNATCIGKIWPNCKYKLSLASTGCMSTSFCSSFCSISIMVVIVLKTSVSNRVFSKLDRLVCNKQTVLPVHCFKWSYLTTKS